MEMVIEIPFQICKYVVIALQYYALGIILAISMNTAHFNDVSDVV